MGLRTPPYQYRLYDKRAQQDNTNLTQKSTFLEEEKLK